jgi:hypothetical protein
MSEKDLFGSESESEDIQTTEPVDTLENRETQDSTLEDNLFGSESDQEPQESNDFLDESTKQEYIDYIKWEREKQEEIVIESSIIDPGGPIPGNPNVPFYPHS